MKKENIEEAEIVEGKVNKNKNERKKSNGGIIFIIITSIILLFAIITLTVLVVRSGKIDILSKLTNNESEKIELKHTESVSVKSEGVYITDVSEVVDEVMPSIVAITSKTVISSGRFGPSFFGNGSYTTEGAGSGVIVYEDDDEIFILTNYHVVEDSSELSVKFIDDKSYDASIKGVSERKDIAIVSVKKKEIDNETLKQIKIATLGNSNELKVGNGIIAIGNALGYGQSVTTGVVSALDREVTIDNITNKMIQIDAAINGGNSGGALLNSAGEVVGINSAKYSSGGSSTTASIEGMGFAIPISNVKELIETLMNGEEDNGGDAKIGIEGYIIESEQAERNNSPVGFYISKIEDGSGADKAGLEIGNIITEIDGNKVEKISDITNVLYDKKKGEKVTLKISYPSKNSYKEKEVEVTLS